ncbi:MAG: ABC transporter substrate-binding protein [Pseudomonadota bacterium]
MARYVSAFFVTFALMLTAGWAVANDYQEVPYLADAVAAGDLPPVTERVPQSPNVSDKEPGQSGGTISWLARRAKDIRIMNVYGYARLVGYNEAFELVPDLLESVEVEEERIFTLTLRPGHKWSDGAPFTSADFEYFWTDIENNGDLKPYGPDYRLLVNDELPLVEIIDEVTVRYTWSAPNPEFLPALAGARPLYIYAPKHYLSQFHQKYADAGELDGLVEASGEKDWVSLHIRRGHLYDADNTALPTLQPWTVKTPQPAERFVFERNPFYHRVDTAGNQLPYLDEVIVNIADSSLIPAKTGAGESDLQARSLRFDNFTFLKAAEERNDYSVRLWPTALGSEIALYPNLTVNDEGWREVLRDVRFRRALSLAVNREEINQVIFFGLATSGNNTALAASPFFSEDRLTRWATFDIDQANALLDEAGLTERSDSGLRLLPDGRPMEITIETAGERSVEIDVIGLIAESWAKLGIKAVANPSQRDVFRNRVFAGEAVMSVWMGLDNALFAKTTVPFELAPVDQNWLQYAKWGQFAQTGGEAGEPPDMEFGIRLMDLFRAWRETPDPTRREEILTEMLEIHASEVTSIGIVQGVLQPVVVSNKLQGVPAEAVYSWDPGSHFGVYRPDTFWLQQ